jgi:lipopolysaccharide export system ATP-binding protein
LTDHQFRETLEVTDRCYVIREGRVFAYGNREEILNNAEVRRHYIGERFDGGHLLEKQRPVMSLGKSQNALPSAEPIPQHDEDEAPPPPPAAPSPPPPPPAVAARPEPPVRPAREEPRGYVQGESLSIQVNQLPPDFNLDDLYGD